MLQVFYFLCYLILLWFFFLFGLVFNNFFITPVVIENVKLKLALGIPKDTPLTVANYATDIPPLAVDKTIKD